MSRQLLTQGDLDDVRRIAARCLGPVAEVQHLPSHQNVVVRVKLADGRRRIVKLAGRDAITGSRGSIGREPGVFKLLREVGLPAPRVHCGEDARGSIGRAWFACDDLGRRTAADTGGLSAANRRALYAEAGRFLARVHDLRLSGGDGGLMLAGGAASPLAQWHGRQIARALDDRLFRNAAADALAGLPAGPTRPSVGGVGPALCHGDFHPAQLIRRGPYLVAAIDWESAHAGDPGYDHAAFEVMLRVTCPPDLAEAALSAYAAARPFHDAGAYEHVRTAHAVALAVTFADARRPAFARSARVYAARRLAGEAAAA